MGWGGMRMGEVDVTRRSYRHTRRQKGSVEITLHTTILHREGTRTTCQLQVYSDTNRFFRGLDEVTYTNVHLHKQTPIIHEHSLTQTLVTNEPTLKEACSCCTHKRHMRSKI